MITSRLLRALCASVAILCLAACKQDMADQPRYGPLAASDFFADGRSARPLVDGTVARGHLREDTVLYTGFSGKSLVNEVPFPVTKAVLLRGQDRYNIYCVPCHDRTGSGNGMVPQRGLRHPPSYHTDRLRNMPVGHFFDVMTRGLGAMPDYAERITAHDRWAIAAYIRVLQFSQNARVEDVPPADRKKLESGAGTEENKER